jgi:hypothetical protein
MKRKVSASRSRKPTCRFALMCTYTIPTRRRYGAQPQSFFKVLEIGLKMILLTQSQVMPFTYVPYTHLRHVSYSRHVALSTTSTCRSPLQGPSGQLG